MSPTPPPPPAAVQQIAALVAELAHTAVAPDATNQYAADGDAGNAVRRANVQRALELGVTLRPACLLIGEAPGYNGARRTGIPFTSERLMLDGVEPPGLFGAQRGFQCATDDGRISREQTATLVWREVAALGVVIVGWNAYPFHPHRRDNPNSNRTPRRAEVRAGLRFLAAFCHLFVGVPVVAMGNTASFALGELGLAHTKIRHPAQGGARLFAAGLRAAVAN